MLFDPEEPEEIAAALTAVLDDPEEAAALRRAGFRRATEFSWEKHAAALDGLFERRRHRPGAVAVAVEYILALAGFCIVSVPGLLLGALCGKLRFRRVFDLAGRPLRLPEVRSESALWRGSPRFAYVLAGRIGLAGDPLRDFEPELACFDRPGVFTPDFIYRSGRLAVQGALRERKQMHRSLWSDLGLVLRTFPALLFGGAGREEEKFHLLGLEVRNRSMREALDHFKECIRERKRLQVAFMNPDCFNIACRDPEYFRLMKERFEVLADGIGLVIAGKLTGQRLRENINGSDMYPHLCEMAEKNGFSIYLLGARPGVAETMRRKTLESYPLRPRRRRGAGGRRDQRFRRGHSAGRLRRAPTGEVAGALGRTARGAGADRRRRTFRLLFRPDPARAAVDARNRHGMELSAADGTATAFQTLYHRQPAVSVAGRPPATFTEVTFWSGTKKTS